jgi:hypothetical protein
MTVSALRNQVEKIRAKLAARAAARSPLIGRLAEDPAGIFGPLEPDPWQAELLRARHDRILMLAGRQCGKSLCAAALGLRTALLEPGSLTLILSPTQRQSGELFRAKLLKLWRALGSPLKSRPPTRTELELSNGARVISLPENEEGVRCFSGVSLLILDEAARVADDLYFAVRPMLATSAGRIVALSTPFGQRGWFWEAWEGPEAWQRVAVKASQCPRISADFLAQERRTLGSKWYSAEYENQFLRLGGGLFSPEDIDAAMNPNLEVLPLG